MPSRLQPRRRSRRTWRTGNFGATLPTILSSCSVHAYRRGIEESRAFRSVRVAAAKLGRAVTQVRTGVAPRVVELTSRETLQLLRDTATGAYGREGDDAFAGALEKVRCSWMSAARAADCDENIAGAYWRRVAARVKQIAATARGLIDEINVVNGNVERVDAYIDAHAKASETCGDVDVEWASRCSRREKDVKERLLRGATNVDERFSRRLKRAVWGFATDGEATLVATECGSLASDAMAQNSDGEPEFTAVRELVDGAIRRVVAERVASEAGELFATASRTVRELHKVSELIELNVIAVSRLENIVSEAFGRWHADADAEGGRRGAWASAWLRSQPHRVFYSAMQLVAGEAHYAIRTMETYQSKSAAVLKTSLEASCMTGGQRREFQRGGKLADDIKQYLENVTDFIEMMKTDKRDVFTSFIDNVISTTYPWLTNVKDADADADAEDAETARGGGGRRFIPQVMLFMAAKRLETNTTTGMRVHAKKRFEALIRAEFALMQCDEHAYGSRDAKRENAAAMRAFAFKAGKRRTRLVTWLSHATRHGISTGYRDWCREHDISVEPTPKLVNESRGCDVDVIAVRDAIVERFQGVVMRGFTPEHVSEVVSVISRCRFTSERDQSAAYDALAVFTERVRTRVDYVRKELNEKLGKPRVDTSKRASVFDEQAVRRFACESALETVWVRFAATMKRSLTMKRAFKYDRERRVFRATVLQLLRAQATTSLADGASIPTFDVDDFQLSLESKQIIDEENPIFAPTASAAAVAKRVIGQNEAFQEWFQGEIEATVNDANVALTSAERLTKIAMSARDKEIQAIGLRGRDSGVIEERDVADADATGSKRLTSRQRAKVLKHMKHCVKRAFDDALASRAARAVDAEDEAHRDEQRDRTPKTPAAGPAPAAEEDVDGSYWLPPKIACSPIPYPGFGVRHQVVVNTALAQFANDTSVVERDALFGGARSGRDEGALGKWLARSLFHPKLNGLAKAPPSSSGSVTAGLAAISYSYEDEVDPNSDAERRRTRDRVPVLSVEESAARNVVFMGVDPGMNKTITAVLVYPKTSDGDGDVLTYESTYKAVSSGALHRSSAPVARAKRNQKRRDEARARALKDGSSTANAISLEKASRGASGEAVRAKVIVEQAYTAVALEMIQWIRYHWHAAVHADDTRWPTVLIACGQCGITKGRGWSGSPMKGAPRTSPGRLIAKITELYPGRLEIDFVDEHSTSKLCPGCDEKLQNFHRNALTLPTEGGRLTFPKVRNGRVCVNAMCSWALTCENRDMLACVNMLRKAYPLWSEYEQHLLGAALKDAFSVLNVSMTGGGGGDGADDDEGDEDTDDELIQSFQRPETDFSVALQNSPSSSAGREKLRNIASKTVEKRARPSPSGSTPDRGTQVRRRVRSPTAGDSEQPVDSATAKDIPSAPRRRLRFATPAPKKSPTKSKSKSA